MKTNLNLVRPGYCRRIYPTDKGLDKTLGLSRRDPSDSRIGSFVFYVAEARNSLLTLSVE